MKILFISSTRIGDAILSTGLIDHLIRRNPAPAVTIACGAPAAPLFEAVPGLDRIIVMHKLRHKGHWLSLWRQAVGTRWDLVIDLRRSLVGWLLLARRRYLMPRTKQPLHRVAQIGLTLGLDPPPSPRLWTRPEHEARAAALLPADSPVLALAPTANWAGKIWPAERFAELALRLTGTAGPLEGAYVLVTGGPGEELLARPVIKAVPKERRLDLVGLDLLTTYAAFRHCTLFVGNDSGLMHLAAAAGIPTLGLFGPSRDEFYTPWGPRAAALRTPESFAELTGSPDYDHRRTGTLMSGLTVDEVECAARSLLRT